MFFKASHFLKVCPDEATAQTAAAIANSVIDKNGVVLYGNRFKDKAGNFSSDKKSKDTHVTIAIGMDEMGLFADEDEILLDTADSDELAAVMAMQIEALKVENAALRRSK